MATVKGTWRFNVSLTKPTWTNEEVVNFTLSYKLSNAKEGFYKMALSSGEYLNAHFYSDGSSHSWTFYQYSGGYAPGWQGLSLTEPMDITFTGEQEVSDEFHKWLIANATYQVPPIIFDLSTLSLTGKHSITVKARGTGYMSSPASEAVEYTA